MHAERQAATLSVIVLGICSEVNLARLPATALQEKIHKGDHRSELVIGQMVQDNRRVGLEIGPPIPQFRISA